MRAVALLSAGVTVEAAVELGSSTDTIGIDDLFGIHRIRVPRRVQPAGDQT